MTTNQHSLPPVVPGSSSPLAEQPATSGGPDGSRPPSTPAGLAGLAGVDGVVAVLQREAARPRRARSLADWQALVGECQRVINMVTAAQDAAIVRMAGSNTSGTRTAA